jgi:hypothetical protein
MEISLGDLGGGIAVASIALAIAWYNVERVKAEAAKVKCETELSQAAIKMGYVQKQSQIDKDFYPVTIWTNAGTVVEVNWKEKPE